MIGQRRQIGTVGARRERGKGQLTSQFHSSSIRMSSSTGEYLCRQFSLAEMQLATGDFGDEHVIGKGGFGKVYKGLIDNGSLIVAVKRLSSNSKQGQREFVAEMETLSKLRHRNLVSLIGYCNEQGEMILVYEYMPNGTLADYLRRKNHRSSSLTWNELLRICIGAARGLDYLHTGSSVIHRDVKPANILLDENFTAKVSDFGLAKHLSGNDLESHVSASIKGSFGYFDPSYFISGRLTKASDTYAFGVVLLEVLSGRPAIDGKLAESELCLTLWAQEIIRNRKFHQIVDSTLREEISEDCLKTYVGVVKRCLVYEPKKRLSMTQAAAQLELALEQQERKGSTPKLKFPSLNAFWSRVAPSGKISNSLNSAGCGDIGSTQRDNREVEVNTMPEDALNSAGCGDIGSTQKDNNEVDVNSVPQDALQSKQSVDELEEQHNDRESYGVPAILLPEVKNITDDFSSKSWIANGSSGGSIFHGVLKNGQEVAIKRLHKKLLNREFLAQVSFLSGLKHENVIELLGYCVAGDVQVLVHEYAARGSLHDLLHGRQGPTGLPLEPGPALSWVQRINIAVGAAKGLLYFHEKSLIHRNIKSSNVLVCANEITKISDPHLSARCHHDWRIDGFVEGCCDYHPPEFETDGYTQKGDIYNFGVLLLELLTGCESVNAQWWVVFKFNQTDLHQNVDPRLKGDYPPKAAETMAGVAELCLKYTADERPSMSDVLQALQIAFLETQDYLLKKKHSLR